MDNNIKDLHDFADVAENYDLYLDVMNKNGLHEGFLDFYLDLAKKYGNGGVIDIACGTGAVLLYLAEHGIIADGTDISEEMCRIASEKAQNNNFALNIFPADMTAFNSGRKYSCAIIARSGFMHLTTPELQRAALLNIRRNLTDNGILSFNTFDPHPVYQAQQMNTKDTDYSLRLEYLNKQGKKERIYNAIGYDPLTQIMNGNWKFETLDDEGNVIDERVRPLKMRQTYRQEMKYLLELCGFEIVGLYGGYKGESVDELTHDLIWVVCKK